jgi:hypothetical protein
LSSEVLVGQTDAANTSLAGRSEVRIIQYIGNKQKIDNAVRATWPHASFSPPLSAVR